jgi:ferredoxin-NADP reductase
MIPMQTLYVPLLDKREIAKHTYTFSFPKPQDFSYTAGQYLSLSVDPPEIAGPGGTMRELSLVSAPYENELVLGLRFRESRAKQQFMKLKKGENVYLQGPFGNFQLKKNDRQVVFLAGGIGIVPLLSMLKQSLHEKEARKFFIFTSNRKKEDIPFLQELETIADHNSNIKLVNTLTLEQPDDWLGEQGYISSSLIQQHVPSPSDAYYYLAGPQRFVGGMWEVLEQINVPSGHIHGEEFTGY